MRVGNLVQTIDPEFTHPLGLGLVIDIVRKNDNILAALILWSPGHVSWTNQIDRLLVWSNLSSLV